MKRIKSVSFRTVQRLLEYTSFPKMPRFVQKWIFSAVCLALLYRASLADIKIWNTNTNFLNPRNWKNGQLPCANDRIIFPASSPVITIMPESLSVSELVLPLDGEVIFPSNAKIQLTGGTQEGACVGKDMEFQPTVDYWYEPLNWNITSDWAFPRFPNRHNAAVPHAFKIPCPTDSVQFPDQTTFQSHIIYPVTTVGSMDINGVSYTQSEFDELLNTHIGSLLFPDKPVVRITGSPCSDESGCICGNERPVIFPTVCEQVIPFCPTLECTDPITPVGSCCPICGAQIMIKHKESFKMNTLYPLYETSLNKKDFHGVESFTAKTYEGDIQSVFVDGDQYRGRANKVAQQILDALQADITGDRTYKLQSVKMYKSESWKSGVPTYDQYTSEGMSSGGVAALVILFIIGLGFAAAFYVYKRRNVSGFDFARFDLRGDKIELELGTTPHDELQPVDSPVASGSDAEKCKGFDNPVYGTAVEEAAAPLVETLTESKDFVENPMFMIFEDTSKHVAGDNKQE